MADSPVLLVDSDATAVAAQQYVPDGWTVAVHDASAPVAASHAVVWGRNDEGGRTWAEAVADAVGVPTTVITLGRLPKHWSLADPLPENRTAEQLKRYLSQSLQRCAVRVAPIPAPQPQAVAVVQSASPPPVTLIDNIDLPYIRSGAHGDGAVKPIMQNCALLLENNPERWILRYNEFAARVCIGSEYLVDSHTLAITSWCQRCGVHAPTATVYDAILYVAHQNTFNPVRAYLESLSWDRIPRLDLLFVDHAGTPDTPLTRAVTGRWFVQAVARVYEPGCQADGTLVLEGPQGLRKSSFFRQLFGDKWFTDHLPDIASKDALLQLRGVWCVEIGELATLGRADSAKIKQFLTSQVDRYRDPYGRVVADFPRTCVFAGSVNPGAGGYLKDETGARRFWPVPVNERINTAAVSAVRDLLWGEAVARYRAGERWYLDTDELERDAAVVAEDRFVADPWQEKIAAFLIGRTQVTTEEIFKVALLAVDVGKWSQGDMARVMRCLSFCGWERKRKDRGRGFVYVPRAVSASDGHGGL